MSEQVIEALARALLLDPDQRRHIRRWWAEYPVRDFKPATIVLNHPEIGRLNLEMFQFRPVEHPDMLMVLQVPRTMDDLQRVTSLLGA